MDDYVTVSVCKEPRQLAAPVLFPQRKPTLQDIQRLQGVCSTLPQVELGNEHYFAPGMYARELFMPAGVLVVGRIHKFKHISIVAYGDVTVYTEQDGGRRYKGYNVVISEAGAKRVLYPHADTMWTTVHATELTNVADIEDQLIEPDDEDAIREYARQFMDEIKGISG